MVFADVYVKRVGILNEILALRDVFDIQISLQFHCMAQNLSVFYKY